MPETLVEFTDGEGEKQSMDPTDFSDYIKDNPDAVVENKKTYSYSGGGIAGPLVGTALLVLVCMVVALIVGVAAAVYLNEYAKQGKLVGMIRLAIMNLAGVPSIVFGLFGFAFFCLFPLPVFVDHGESRAIDLPIRDPDVRRHLSFKSIGKLADGRWTHPRRDGSAGHHRRL